MQWETVIGLEVHTQLATQSKIFSGASSAYGAEANTQACPIDLGLPGVLPVLNQAVPMLALRLGLALHAEIPPRSIFARKNYFYPDLPKGYQISQYELPIVSKGVLPITLENGTIKEIGVTRAHLEEDAGKSLHENLQGATGIDLNRAGVPLLEIVSEPDMRSAEEAVAYLKTLHTLVRYLGVSDANMQEGSFRCDVNISLRPVGSTKLGTRTELKNLNSFRFIEQAIHYETERQQEILESGGEIRQETRLYDPNANVTRPMRGKEEANDYRYFPDPDLLPIDISKDLIDSVAKTLPELPWEKLKRFSADYGLSNEDAKILTLNQAMADYFEDVVKSAESIGAKAAANWVIGELTAALNTSNLSIEQSPVSGQQLGALLSRIADNTISNKIAKEVFNSLWQGEGSVDEIIEKKGLKQITDSSAIEKIIDEVINNNPNQLEQYRAGKEKLFGFFVGQVMKETRGKANPQQVNQLLKQKLVG